MLSQFFYAEIVKEKRSANQKLVWFVPFFFIAFSVLMTGMMGHSEEGQSYLTAVAFNWYPLMILPAVISLLVSNISYKEKEVHKLFYHTLGKEEFDQTIAKILVVMAELFFVLFLSSTLILLINAIWLKEVLAISSLFLATSALFIGSLPILAFSFLLSQTTNRFLIILSNFVLGIVSAIVATRSWWFVFPWSYNIRMMSPILGVHPNGTFLSSESPLLSPQAILVGCVASIFFFGVGICFLLLIKKRGQKNG